MNVMGQPKKAPSVSTPAFGQIWKEIRTGRIVRLEGSPETDERFTYRPVDEHGQRIKKKSPATMRRDYFLATFALLKESARE